jgi:TolB-like protein/AraC-like DNA-binding protein/tetratricopeptide (TPR) repeat protein
MTESLSMDQAFIRKLTDIILTNIRNEHFGVGDLAREAGVSRITIHRKIRSIKNQDATQFIREIRLRRAMELLKQNAGTVSEIAFMVGFGSPAYFNKCFHEFFGFPPGKVKKEAIQSFEEITQIRAIETTKQKRPVRRTFVALSLGVLFFAVAIICYNFIFNNSYHSASSLTKRLEPSIAVLPFVNSSSVDSNKYVIDGLMEEIVANLSKIKALRVLSKTSTEQFRGTSKSPSEIAGILDVKYLVEGSGQMFGNKLVLRVGLIDVANQNELWAKSYSRQILHTTDFVSLQSEIAQSITTELKAVITPEEKQLIDKKSYSDLTALDFYQRAREEFGTFPFHDLIVSSTTYPIFFDNPLNRKVIVKAKRLFATAIQYDSTFAPAYTDLAAIYWSENYFRDYFSKNYLDSVLLLANKALSFDDRLPDAYYMRAMYYGETGNIKQARLDFDKTLQLDPNHWMAYYGKGALYLEEFPDADYTVALDNFLKAVSRYHGSALPFLLQRIAYTLNITGFSELAFRYNLKASQLEQDSAKYFFSMYELGLWGGDPEKAYGFLEKALKEDSNNVRILWYQAFYLTGKGDFNNTLRVYRKYQKLLKENGITMVNDLHRIALIYSELGMIDSAEYYYKKQIENCNAAIRLGRPYGISFAYFDLAIIYALKGDREKALENLYIFSKREGMVNWFMFGGFKNDPEFQKIRKEIYTKSQAEHERVRKWLEANNML